MHNGCVRGQYRLVRVHISTFKMVAVVLDDIRLNHCATANLALHSGGPCLDIAQLQHARIDRDHPVFSEIGILADIHRLAWITAVPIKWSQYLVVQHETGIETIRDSAVGIQIQRNVKHSERRPRHGPRRYLVCPTEKSREIVVVLFALE